MAARGERCVAIVWPPDQGGLLLFGVVPSVEDTRLDPCRSRNSSYIGVHE